MKLLLIILGLFTSITFSQETCEDEEVVFEDLNSITKCSIKPSKKTDGTVTRQVSVKISAPKKRYLKKRAKKRAAKKKKTAATLNSVNTSGVSSKLKISNSIEIKQESTAINNILAITNKLTKEEINKAVSFDEIINIPLFSNCNKSSKKKELACFNNEMIKHIENYFTYPKEAILNKLQGNVWVRFIIGKDGTVSNIKTLGPKGAKVLDNAAIRVVAQLPRFIPGEEFGRKVPVKYGFPISFSLEE